MYLRIHSTWDLESSATARVSGGCAFASAPVLYSGSHGGVWAWGGFHGFLLPQSIDGLSEVVQSFLLLPGLVHYLQLPKEAPSDARTGFPGWACMGGMGRLGP